MGIADQCSPVSIRFDNVDYYAHQRQRCTRKTLCSIQILDDLSGQVEPGDLVALMGPSGAGKSTLLNVLSGRVSSYTGSVVFDGCPKAKSSFVQQEDIFYAYLTVKEHLQSQARLRLPVSQAKAKEIADNFVKLFNLETCKDCIIGSVVAGTKRGISGGEKKRLSVASELLEMTSVIFADEPTSGLDASIAEDVVEVLRTLARRGHTVVATIHQPSVDVFQQFNKVILLSEGKMVYFGRRMDMVAYFASLGYPCPPFTNEANFILELLAVDYENQEKSMATIDRLVNCWKDVGKKWVADRINSPTEKDQQLELPDNKAETAASEVFEMTHDPNHSVRWYAVIFVLLRRMFLDLLRNPTKTYAKIFQSMFVAIVSSTIYIRLPQSQWYSKTGALYMLSINLGFQAAADVTYSFGLDSPIAQREKESGLYSAATFFLSRNLTDLPMMFIVPILFYTISYWTVGFRDDGLSFITVAASGILLSYAVSAFGYVASAIGLKRPAIGNAITPLFIVPLIMTHPFVINTETLNKFWYWAVYSSPWFYMWKVMMVAIFDGVSLGIPDCQRTAIDLCTGADVLARYEVYPDDVWWYCLVTFVIGTVGRLVALTILHFNMNSKQNE